MDITRVTIIPSDKMILVNGAGLQFDFTAPENVHAIQWDNVTKTGHVEYENCILPNKDLVEADYAEEVFPFVLLWQAEKERLAAEQKAAEEAEQAQYNSEEARWERLRTERDSRLAATDYYILPDYPSDADMLEKVKQYRQELRDLTSLEGAPWTDDTIPWPVNPLEASSTAEEVTE